MRSLDSVSRSVCVCVQWRDVIMTMTSLRHQWSVSSSSSSKRWD